MSEALVAILPTTRAPGYALNRFLLTGALLLAALATIAALGPWIAPHDPAAVEVRRVLGAPDFLHPFGSDVLGRDVLSRVIYGLRVSLLVSVSAVAASLAGICGMSVPAGETAAGLPIGVQVLGRHFDESTVLRVGAAIEAAQKSR